MTNPATNPATDRTGDPDDQRYGPDGRFRVRVEPDPAAGGNESPREFCNVGTMVLSEHRHYTFPREWLTDPEKGTTVGVRVATLAEWLIAEHGATVVLPVWAYDHGSLYLKAGERTHPFDDKWDSALAGVIYDTPAGREETGVPANKIEEALIQEVELYDKWARGEMYYYVIERRDADGWNEVDSCHGYFSEEEAREQGIHAVPDTLDKEAEAAANTAIGDVLDAARQEARRTLDNNPNASHADLAADVVRFLARQYLPEHDPLRQVSDDGV
jgi:hypothetical protein